MAVQFHCPACQELVPVGARNCPHCGVLFQTPAHTNPEGHASELLLQPQQVSQQKRQGSLFTNALPEALKQLDTTANTNITISGVLIAFYAGAIFAGHVQASQPFNALIYAAPVVLLLITIIISVSVFYPMGYLLDDYTEVLRKKDRRMRASSLLLECSVAILAVSVFVYITRP
jgi:hypothetical protein